MPDILKVGIVGTGIGRNHAAGYQALPEHYQIAAVCDIDAARGEAFAKEFGVPRAVTSLDELLAMDDIDVVDICTPPGLHFAQSAAALRAGKHAVCEKPLVGSVREADELAQIEAASGRRLMPIFQYRFGHGLQKLKRLVDMGVAGRLYLATVETAWRRRAAYYDVPWRGKWATELGGAILGHAIHAHDMLSYIVGAPSSVYCRATTLVNPIEVEDTAAASLALPGGGLATLAVTLGSSEEVTRHRFCFEGFVAESNTRAYSNSGEPWSYSADTPELEGAIAAALEGYQPLPEGFPGQFYRFHRALRDGTELPVTLADARASLELITALYYSAQTEQSVELPIGPDHPKYGGWVP